MAVAYDYASGGTATNSITYTCSNDTTWVAWSTCTASTTTTVWNAWAACPYTADDFYRNLEQQQQLVYPDFARLEPVAADSWQAACEKAEELLKSLLSEQQLKDRAEKGFFDLVVEGGNKPARTYRIRRGASGNIKKIVDGKEVESWCVHAGQIPEADTHVAQVLHLLTDDEALRKVANITRLAA